MGRFGNRNSLSINVQIPPYFSLYILSIDLLNKCQWHLILYILLLVLDSYNIMNHYFLTCSNGFQISLWAQVKGFVPNYIIKSLSSCTT